MVVTVRLSPTEALSLDQRRGGLSRSDYLRAVLFGGPEVKRGPDPYALGPPSDPRV